MKNSFWGQTRSVPKKKNRSETRILVIPSLVIITMDVLNEKIDGVHMLQIVVEDRYRLSVQDSPIIF